MSEGELAAVFKGLADDAGEAGGEIAESIAKFTDDTADIEDANVARTLAADADTASAAKSIDKEPDLDSGTLYGNEADTADEAKASGGVTGDTDTNWAGQSGTLRAAAAGKGNFGLGSATAEDAESLGRSWVGDGYRVASDGKTLISQDGMRQFRAPSYKPSLGIYQANFEQRVPGQVSKQWFSNGHLNITDLP
jgi:hypothetical protein